MTTTKRMTDVEMVRTFVLAGNARLTLVSGRTGARYTFRVRRADEERDGRRPWFVSTLIGQNNDTDFAFIATVHDRVAPLEERLSVRRGGSVEDVRVKAFAFLLRCLDGGALPASFEVWHEGRCGRCARVLTVPSSIESGFGPECVHHVLGGSAPKAAPALSDEEKRQHAVGRAQSLAISGVVIQLPVSSESDRFNREWVALKNESGRREMARERDAYLAEMEEEDLRERRAAC